MPQRINHRRTSALLAAVVCTMPLFHCPAAAGTSDALLQSARELRDELRGDLRQMPSLLRCYTFQDTVAEGLTFVPGPGEGQVDRTEGRWPEQAAVRLDRGWLQAEAVDIPEGGFTVTCWFRHHGMGGLTHYQGRAAYSNGGIVTVGRGWHDGWRVVVAPESGSLQFTLGRPDNAAASAVGRHCVEAERWQHLAATWDRRHINIYIDGHLRAETAYDGDYTQGHPDWPLRIGEAGYGVGTVKLDVAELALFSAALSPERIARMANPAAPQSEQIVACLRRGDRAPEASRWRFWQGVATREARARAEYSRVLALDTSEAPHILGNYHAIARLRIAASLRREGKLRDATDVYRRLADADDVALHYRAQAMQALGAMHRDQRQYTEARQAYTQMLEFFTGRHENFRVEAMHRLADVEGLKDGEPFLSARQRRIVRISHPTRTFTVAPDGDDTAAGTEQKPFATLERARDAVRDLKQGVGLPAGGVAVVLRQGVYRRTTSFALSAADSGALATPVIYRSHPGEKAILSGGVELTGFQPLTAATAPPRLPATARDHVVALDLRKAGVTDFGSIQPRGFALEPVPAHLELFFNDAPMQLARWPNPVGRIAEDYTTIRDFTGADVVDFLGKPMSMANAFVYGDERQANWKDEPDAWLLGYWARWYAARILKVTSVDPAERIIRMGEPGPYHRPSWKYKHGGVLKGAPYFAVNLLCELDSPGEWYLDRDSGMLFFWPPSPLAQGTAVVSILAQPLLTLNDVSHVVFRGLTLEAGRADAVRINGGDGVLLAGCVIRNMGNWGVVVGGMGTGANALPDPAAGGRNHELIGCDISGTGDGGVSLLGGDLKTLTPSGHVVENCHIHHFDRWNRAGYQPGIIFDGVGCRASHNLIHDGPHQGIRLRCNDHIFEYNEVHDTPYEAREMGTFYMYGRSRVLGERGNIARYNWFHHIPYTDALAKDFVSGGRLVFHIDHMNGGMTIYGNIFQALESTSGAFFSGGRENMIENNVFYQCLSGVTLGDRSFCYEGENKPPKCSLDNYLRSMPHDQPPWSVRYPQLATLLDREQRALPENNLVARNIGVKVQQLLRIGPVPGKLSTVESNWDGPDPGFANPGNGDFSIRPDSTVFGAIGFDPLPVERIGLYKDELRATWPVSHAVDTHEHMSVQRKALEDMPTARARLRAAAIDIDGRLDPAEWGGLRPEDALVLDRSPNEGPSPALRSTAWVCRDAEALYIAVLNHVNPDKPLVKDDSLWWRSDMVEVIIEGQIGVDTQGWWLDEAEHGPLFYLVGDFQGNCGSIRMAGLPREPAEKLQRTAQYAAVVKDASCWTAEWRIPFASICLDPAESAACCFNIGVGKPGTPIDPAWPHSKRNVAAWAVWAGTGGPNWQVWNAGRLVLRQ